MIPHATWSVASAHALIPVNGSLHYKVQRRGDLRCAHIEERWCHRLDIGDNGQILLDEVSGL